eukprot:4030517-Pyramimonas_sp.AAC.2
MEVAERASTPLQCRTSEGTRAPSACKRSAPTRERERTVVSPLSKGLEIHGMYGRAPRLGR